MKKIIIISSLFALIFSSCSSVYICVTGSEIPIYYNPKVKNSEIMTKVPKGEIVIVKGKRKYRKIKYKKYIGWSYLPLFTDEKKYLKRDPFKEYIKKRNKYNSHSGKVYVKGYYRKDGTYVRPHTRSKPKSYKRKSYKRKSYKRKKYY